MTLKFNYTGRKAIPHDMISIKLNRLSPDGLISFDAQISDLGRLDLPVDGLVFLEPYVQQSSMRFDFGTVGTLIHPKDCLLTDIDQGRSVLFHFFVVDATATVGKIIAACRGIAPAGDDETRSSLLPLDYEDLGQEVWKLPLERGSQPRLVLNSRYPEIKDRLLGDPLLMGAIFPVALKRILHFIREEVIEEGATELKWVSDWRRFVLEISGSHVADTIFCRDIKAHDDDESSSVICEEINNVVERFLHNRNYINKALRSREVSTL